MDYVVGSIAALISGNVTPNRPKLIRRALTPTKHPSSPNVTPKSEAVDDRTIFLSPSVQKKKAIVKKSPKRIFENPDLDITEGSENSSPKADKVKKHLKNELEADVMGKSNILDKKSPSSRLGKSEESASAQKKIKINDSQVSNENTPKKNKKRSEPEGAEYSSAEEMDVDSTPTVVDKGTPKKTLKQKLPVDNSAENKASGSNNQVNETRNNQTGKKKNKKRKKNNKAANIIESETVENTITDKENKITEENMGENTKSLKKKKNRKNKNKKAKLQAQSKTIIDKTPQAKAKSNDDIEDTEDETKEVSKEESETVENTSTDKENKITEENKGENTKSLKKKKNRKNKNKKAKLEKQSKTIKDKTLKAKAKSNDDIEDSEDETQEASKDVDDSDEEESKEVDDNEPIDRESKQVEDQNDEQYSESEEDVSNIANPNAITEKDTDSEHESDDEIESDNEDTKGDKNQEDESSDDESQAKKKGKQKKKAEKTEVVKDGEKEMHTEEEIKRTLFVGNVPFSNKCKKEIKKIFAQYGDIETVRIRTVPVKDGRVTPKLAVIKNEIHPDRSTVNVYIKFADPDSVERALAENNTVLNDHHLRVSRSSATGVEHNPDLAVFVGNLPFAIEDETLRAKFEKCGEIESVRIVRDKKTNAGKGFGYVNFASKDGVELALGLSEEDLTVKNRIIRVKRCTHTLKKGAKNGNKSLKQGQRKDFGNSQGQNRNFGNNRGQDRNNQGQNRNFGNSQGQNRNFGNNQGQNKNFGNNQGQNRNFGNNQGQNRNFGNNQGQNRNFGNNQGPRNFGSNQNKFGNQGNEGSGASRRIMNKRPHQENGDGPPNKKQNLSQQPREKKQRKEFVGLTAEKKKKQKFDKGQKKKKVISEIMTKT